MNDLIEAIRAAVTQGATPEQKALGAQACRTILTALDTEAGKPLAVPNAPTPHPLSQIDPGQALDLLIAKLSAGLPKEDAAESSTAPAALAPRRDRGLRIEFVSPPPRSGARRRRS
ncbi:MAG: hypothetical protein HS111_22025 [Kofleriaceae bacterium]|nr:hypothetical protein [Kofleriaceae bacterium]MCL4224371.1 hypothetical protein [Myxococcales bacterium]